MVHVPHLLVMLVVCGHFIGRDFLYLPKKDFFFILSSCDVEIKITIFNKMQIKKKIVWKMKYQLKALIDHPCTQNMQNLTVNFKLLIGRLVIGLMFSLIVRPG